MADEYKVAVQQQGRQQQMQMQQGGMPRTPAAAAASPSRTDPAGLQRLTAALTAVLSSGMASDYVEGLKPVLHNGKLAISTYIKLDQDPEPVFIGMFNSLPAAVQAQKQSTELVGHLPPGVARKLIAQQLAHTDPTAAGGPSAYCHGDPAASERWQSNTTSESTAVGAGSSSQAAEGDATPKAVKQEQQQKQQQQQQDDSVTRNLRMFRQQQSLQSQAADAAAEQQQQRHQDRLQSALAAAAAAGAQGNMLAPGTIAAAVAASPRQHASAATDDMLRMLLHKGLNALTEAQHQDGQQGSNWQQQQQQLEMEQSLLDIFNTPVSTPGSRTGLGNALQQLPSPQQQQQQQQLLLAQQQQQQQQRQALMQQLGPAATQGMDRRTLLINTLLRESQQAGGGLGAAAGALSAANALNMQQQQQYRAMGMGSAAAAAAGMGAAGMQRPGGSGLPPLLPLASGQGRAGGAADAGLLNGDIGLTLDNALESAMLQGMSSSAWGGGNKSAAMQMSAAAGYSTAAPGYLPAGAGAQQMTLSGGFQQQQQQAPGFSARGQMSPASQGLAAAGYSAGGGADYGMSSGFAAGAFGMQHQMQGSMGMQGNMQQQYAAGAAGGQFGGEFEQDRAVIAAAAAAAAAAAGAAAAAAAAGGGSDQHGEQQGVGDKRKRQPQTDPRVNCVKSVQYRVSRFPAELHDLCIEHWERARCARVVCNDVEGVMSVQNGRCVVTFNQNNSEVVKGVADYLRYAGEQRIKKWRRHVRMVDFPRPGNRSGELMTAEEFLCIVGYQSEQGGGKKARGDYE